jgi:predicted SnoaL-like aldol condensation-catalyzing enzyme
MPAHNTNLLEQFNEAFNQHDAEGMMALMTGDPLFENTYPAPDGTHYQGYASVKQFWEAFFASSPKARIEIEEMFVCQERGLQRWVYHWTDAQGIAGHVRGVDVFRFQDGKIAEKLSYVKG